MNAGALTVSATVAVDGADATSTFGAQSVAGAGGGKVSVAGSFALAIVDHTTTASVQGAVAVAGGAAAITAASSVASTVKALPHGEGVVTTEVGVGASVALNLVTDRTTAEIADAATLTGAAALTIASTRRASRSPRRGWVRRAERWAFARRRRDPLERHDDREDRHGRARGGSGALSVIATQKATAATTATAAVLGASDAGIGLSMALTVAGHVVNAMLARSVTAASVTLRASEHLRVVVDAEASAAGAPENPADSGDAANPGGEPGAGVDQAVAAERDHASATSVAERREQERRAAPRRAPNRPQGKVNAAAAVAITLATVSAEADVAAGAAITAAGRSPSRARRTRTPPPRRTARPARASTRRSERAWRSRWRRSPIGR